MAAEIHEVGSESPPTYSENGIDEKKDNNVRADVLSDFEEDKNLGKDRAEATELVPTEAFHWNVDGDQSPCEYSASTHPSRCKMTILTP